MCASEDARVHGLVGHRGRGARAGLKVPANASDVETSCWSDELKAWIPHLEVDLKHFLSRTFDSPNIKRMLVSARTGEGIDAWRTWLWEVRGRALSGAAV